MSHRDPPQPRRDGKGGRGRQQQQQHHAPQAMEAEAQHHGRQQNARADQSKRTPSERGTPTSSSARSPHAARQRRSDDPSTNRSAYASQAQAQHQQDSMQRPALAEQTMYAALHEPPAPYSHHPSAAASRLPSPASATAQSEVRSVNNEANSMLGAHDTQVREMHFRIPACMIA